VSIEILGVVEAIFKNRRPPGLTMVSKSVVIKVVPLRRYPTMWQGSLSFAWLPFVLSFWIANTAYPSARENGQAARDDRHALSRRDREERAF